MTQQQAQAKRLQSFLVRWLKATIAGLIDVRVDRSGRVQAKDALGWRDVGTMADWIPLARSLGAL